MTKKTTTWILICSKKILKAIKFYTSLTSGVVLRLSSSSRASCIFRNETVRRRSVFGFIIGKGITPPPLLFALVLLLLWCFPVAKKIYNFSDLIFFELDKINVNLPVSWVESPDASTGCGVGGADWKTNTRAHTEEISAKLFLIEKKNAKIENRRWFTSWSMFVAAAGVPGAGDIGSGVFAPLDWLSIRRLARDRVLYGNFKKVVNFFRSSANARSWRCAYASLLISSSDVVGVGVVAAPGAAASASASGASSVFSDFDSCGKWKHLIKYFWI